MRLIHIIKNTVTSDITLRDPKDASVAGTLKKRMVDYVSANASIWNTAESSEWGPWHKSLQDTMFYI